MKIKKSVTFCLIITACITSVVVFANAKTEFEMNPKNQEDYFTFAVIEYSKGDYLKAIKYCNEGIKAGGGTFDLFSTKAQAMEKLGNIDGAILALTEAVKLPQNSQTGAAYYTMAKLEYSKNNLKSAAKDYIKASESYMWESGNSNNNKKIYIKLANEARLKATAIQQEISQKKQK